MPVAMAAAFAIHLVHVLAMAVVVGGALAGAMSHGSRRLEATLWAALGALVVTGVGNVGAYGTGLPGTGTRWGALLLAKLLFVVAVLALSLRRSMLVWAGRPAVVGYGTTAALAVIIASIGVWLAHG